MDLKAIGHTGSGSGPRRTALVVGAVLILLVVLRVALPLAIVQPGESGVVIRFGTSETIPIGPGLHLIPFFSRVVRFDTRLKKVDDKGDGSSHDLQSVGTNLAINYHINPTQVVFLFNRIGTDYENTAIAPAVQETFKAVVAQYTAEELITKREQVRDAIKMLLAQKFQERTGGSLVLDEVSITNFGFSQSFNDAIEAKVTAEQSALKAQRDLERVKIEAEQKVATAQAEAEALKAQKEQITPEMLQLRWIEKWDGHLPATMAGSNAMLGVGMGPGSAK